jgi:putative hydrolase of the HAD superfamily
MKVICFDLFNTLVKEVGGGAGYEEALISLGIERSEIYPVVRDKLMTRSLDQEEMISFLFDHFELSGFFVERQEALKDWRRDNSSAQWLPGAKKLLLRLKKQGSALVLVTNVTKPGWQAVESKLQISRYFDRLFLSFEQQVTKPNPEVWHRVMSWYPGLKPEHFTMIGDRLDDDLWVPANLGWKTRQVKK